MTIASHASATPPVGTHFETVRNSRQRIFVLTVDGIDTAMAHMHAAPYQPMGFSVHGPRYRDDALPCYVELYARNAGEETPYISLHGTVIEAMMKRGDLSDQQRETLAEAHRTFACFAHERCWGPAQHPALRPQAPVA